MARNECAIRGLIYLRACNKTYCWRNNSSHVNRTRLICQNAAAQGKLEGRIDEEQIAIRLFSSQRLARLDWMHGYIDLETYRTQVQAGMLIALCADATNDFKEELFANINTLK